MNQKRTKVSSTIAFIPKPEITANLISRLDLPYPMRVAFTKTSSEFISIYLSMGVQSRNIPTEN